MRCRILSDRALDQATAEDLRAILLTTPGVREVHELRTRKMGDLAIVDAHILVDPLISVSEGHYIAESARAHMLTDARVIDALIHVDPESDARQSAAGQFPVAFDRQRRCARGVRATGFGSGDLNLHYLSSGFDVDVMLPAPVTQRTGAAANASPSRSISTRSNASSARVRFASRRRCDLAPASTTKRAIDTPR